MVIFRDLFFDLGVGDLRGTFVEQSWANHYHDVKVTYFDEFPNLGGAFSEDSRQLGIVGSYGSSGLQDELGLAFW